MIDDLDLDELRRVRRISYYFGYPLHRDDFHELKVRERLQGHYTAKPLYGRLTSSGHGDRSAGYNGDVAALYIPREAGCADDASLFVTHINPADVALPSGQRNWPVIRAAAEHEILVAITDQDAREPDRRPQIIPGRGVSEMTKKFKVGDHVSWNSEAGRVSGKIVKVHTRDFDYKGHTHHASKENPQYEIKSDKTDHVAAHKGSALSHA